MPNPPSTLSPLPQASSEWTLSLHPNLAPPPLPHLSQPSTLASPALPGTPLSTLSQPTRPSPPPPSVPSHHRHSSSIYIAPSSLSPELPSLLSSPDENSTASDAFAARPRTNPTPPDAGVSRPITPRRKKAAELAKKRKVSEGRSPKRVLRARTQTVFDDENVSAEERGSCVLPKALGHMRNRSSGKVVRELGEDGESGEYFAVGSREPEPSDVVGLGVGKGALGGSGKEWEREGGVG